MFDIAPENLWETVSRVRNAPAPPLVHCIMNYVAAADCANALLAAGARPVMADCADESAEITAAARGLVLNMGTFSPERGRAMLASGRAANERVIPVVLDPVGVSATALRREWFARLTSEIRLAAVKGNLREMAFIADESPDDDDDAVKRLIVLKAAQRLGCAALMTGTSDYLSDGEGVCRFDNGTTLLAKVTGTGCMTGALMGAFADGNDGASACAAAVSLMNIAGELAAENFRGTGTFRTELIDGLSQITREQFLSRIKISE